MLSTILSVETKSYLFVKELIQMFYSKTAPSEPLSENKHGAIRSCVLALFAGPAQNKSVNTL